MSQCLGTGNDQTLFQFDEPGLAYREGGYAGYKETEAAGPCRAAGGTLSAGSENIVVRPCWWDGKPVAPTLTCRFKPTGEVLASCREAGRKLAEVALKA